MDEFNKLKHRFEQSGGKIPGGKSIGGAGLVVALGVGAYALSQSLFNGTCPIHAA